MTRTAADRAAVFLDRDGTLIEDTGYPRDPSCVRLLPGVPEALRKLTKQGFLLVLVSNQSGIGRGLVTPEEAAAVHERLLELLQEHGVKLHAAYYCPHAPEESCSCRKPAPGLLRQAAAEKDIALDQSFMVGDKASDVEAGKRAGCYTIWLSGTHPEDPHCQPDGTAHHWDEVLAHIVRQAQMRNVNQ